MLGGRWRVIGWPKGGAHAARSLVPQPARFRASGCQALSCAGTSRSGITISAGCFAIRAAIGARFLPALRPAIAAARQGLYDMHKHGGLTPS